MSLRHGTQWGMSTDTAKDWTERAACRDADPELFAPLQHAHLVIEKAVAFCCRCPAMVRLECLREGEAFRDQWTVRGGLTGPEREAHRLAGLRVQDYPPHQPGKHWCARCHQPFTFDKANPHAKFCPDCWAAARSGRDGRGGHRLDVCVECEQVKAITGQGKCGGCYTQLARRRAGASR